MKLPFHFNSLPSKNKFDIVINIWNTDNGEYLYHPVKLSPFEYGIQEDIDSVFVPEKVKFEFTIMKSNVPQEDPEGEKPTCTDYQNELIRIFKHAIRYDSQVVIYKNYENEFNNGQYFYGFIDKGNVQMNLEYYSITFMLISNFSLLKTINPKTEYLGYNVDEKDTFPNIIKRIVKHVIPDLKDVVLKSEITCDTNFTFLGETWQAGAAYIGNIVYNYVGPASYYDSMYDLLREMLNNLCSVGILYGNYYYIVPRGYYPGLNLKILSAEKVIQSPNMVGWSPVVDGLVIKIRHETFEPWTSTAGEIGDTKTVETVYLTHPGGWPPGVAHLPANERNIWVYVPEYVAGLGNAQWTTSLPDSFRCHKYGPLALWEIIKNVYWDLNQNGRQVFDIVVDGVNINFHDFWKFRSEFSEIFRIKYMEIDEIQEEISTLKVVRADY